MLFPSVKKLAKVLTALKAVFLAPSRLPPTRYVRLEATDTRWQLFVGRPLAINPVHEEGEAESPRTSRGVKACGYGDLEPSTDCRQLARTLLEEAREQLKTLTEESSNENASQVQRNGGQDG